MTYKEICNALSAAGIDSFAREAAMLLNFYCSVPESEIIFRKNENFESPELLAAVQKRCLHYPLQYIFGEWSFCGEVYEVNENCLIPREDTERLVEKAAELLPRGARFVDLCTGSGCIAISLLARRRDLRGVCVDIFPETLALAKKNAERNGVSERLSFVLGDVLDGEFMSELGVFDAIISNPPYIPTDVVDNSLALELSHEPRAALDGGRDGLVFYRKLISEYGKYTADGGKMLFEIGFDQGESIRALADENGYSCEIFADYGGNDRVAVLKRKNV